MWKETHKSQRYVIFVYSIVQIIAFWGICIAQLILENAYPTAKIYECVYQAYLADPNFQPATSHPGKISQKSAGD